MKTFISSIKNPFVVFFSIIALTFSHGAKAQTDQEIVQRLADATAQTLMQKVSPNTGYGAYSRVKDWSFNSYTKEITIKIEAYWSAKRYMMASSTETFNIDGVLTIDFDDDELDFVPTYKNTAVKYAWSDSDIVLATALTYRLLSNN